MFTWTLQTHTLFFFWGTGYIYVKSLSARHRWSRFLSFLLIKKLTLVRIQVWLKNEQPWNISYVFICDTSPGWCLQFRRWSHSTTNKSKQVTPASGVTSHQLSTRMSMPLANSTTESNTHWFKPSHFNSTLFTSNTGSLKLWMQFLNYF